MEMTTSIIRIYTWRRMRYLIPKAKSPIGHFPSVSEYVNLIVSDTVVIASSHVAGAWAGLLGTLLFDLDCSSPLSSSPPFDANNLRTSTMYRITAAPAAVAIAAAAIRSVTATGIVRIAKRFAGDFWDVVRSARTRKQKRMNKRVEKSWTLCN